MESKTDYAAIAAEEITFTFDTVFIVRKTSPHKGLEAFEAYLNSIGDSLVIGEDDDCFKVHVPPTFLAPLTEAQKYGTLELAKIENMRTQAEDRPPAATSRAPTIWTRWRPSWRGITGHGRSPRRRRGTAWWPWRRATAWPRCSAT